MLEININIKATELAEAIKDLAKALTSRTIKAVKTGMPEKPISEKVIPIKFTGPVSVPPTAAPTSMPPVQQTAPHTVQQPQQQPQPTAVPTSAQTYTQEQLAVAGMQLMDAGKMKELQQLLAKFGVQALTMLPKEQYGAFATELRALGAKL